MSGMDRLSVQDLEYMRAWHEGDNLVARAVGELLAHRRASQAAPAPSDGLRAAWISGRDAAKKVAGTFCWNRCVEGGKLKNPAVFTTHTWQRIQEAIDAECPVPDALTPAPAQDGGGPLTDRQLRDQITGEDR